MKQSFFTRQRDKWMDNVKNGEREISLHSVFKKKLLFSKIVTSFIVIRLRGILYVNFMAIVVTHTTLTKNTPRKHWPVVCAITDKFQKVGTFARIGMKFEVEVDYGFE